MTSASSHHPDVISTALKNDPPKRDQEICYTDLFKDADCTSSSSSGVVSSSTPFDSGSFDGDCLAFRAPWATPPTATFESHRLPPATVTSPTSSTLSSSTPRPRNSLVQSPNEFHVTDLGDSFPRHLTSFEETTRSAALLKKLVE